VIIFLQYYVLHITFYCIFACVTKKLVIRYTYKLKLKNMETLTSFEERQYNEAPGNSHAVLIHLSALINYLGVPFGSILGPLITWLIWRDDDEFVDRHGKEALNFNLSMLIYKILLVVIGLFLFLSPLLAALSTDFENPLSLFLGIPGLWILLTGYGLLAIFRLVAIIVAAVKAGAGEDFHYPLSIRFIK